MARPVTLFTGQWADMPISELAAKAGEWGFDGLELACWGDPLRRREPLRDPSYARGQRELLERHGLQCWALGAHLVGQAICDPIDARHRAILPPEVRGDGDPERVRSRAAERLADTARAAAAFGINMDPSHVAHQFLDPAAFVDEFADTIYHVHVKDSRMALDGRRSILGSHLDFGSPERGWDFVSPGRGDVDFEAFIRALDRAGYAGPLSMEDAGMDREYGAQVAFDAAFAGRHDFEDAGIGQGA
jgi:sugar phosphate isomerase/epimerase